MKLIWTWLAGFIIVAALASPAVAQLNLDLKTTIDCHTDSDSFGIELVKSFRRGDA